VEISDWRLGTKTYIGTHVQGAAAAAADALNGIVADADAPVVGIVLEVVGVDSADAEYSFRIVLSPDCPEKDSTLNLWQVVQGSWHPPTETCSSHFLSVC
jgi:hypothetical protein